MKEIKIKIDNARKYLENDMNIKKIIKSIKKNKKTSKQNKERSLKNK